MRKITLLTTATLLSLACIGGSSLSVDAASLSEKNFYRYGNKIIIMGGNACDIDIDSVLNQFLQTLPCPPAQTPDTELPDTEAPDTEAPEENAPDAETPEENIPDTSNPIVPDNNLPGIPDAETPDAGTPDTGTPDAGTPDTETPDAGTPDTGTPDTETPGNNQNASYIEQVVNLVNIERAKEGLAPLTIDKNVQKAAQVRAEEIVTSFSHTRPNGSSFSTALAEQNVSYRRAGENIAWGQRSPEEVVNAWMNSAGHRANIMNSSFTRIGVGYYQNARGVKYWSQLFIG